MIHPLHDIVGECVDSAQLLVLGCEVIKDPACTCRGEQRIPLFVSPEKSRAAQYCNVDLLVIHNDRVRVIIEIEESDVKPTQICGKFLTAALSSYYIHKTQNDMAVPIVDALFIQVLDTKRLKSFTSKPDQWTNLERSIQSILPLKNSGVSRYRLFLGDAREFRVSNANQLITCMKTVLAYA